MDDDGENDVNKDGVDDYYYYPDDEGHIRMFITIAILYYNLVSFEELPGEHTWGYKWGHLLNT